MPLLTTYLVGIMYHEPEPFALWNAGVVEDYESSTGVFVDAGSRDEAIAWGKAIGEAALRRLNSDDSLDWKSFGYFAWIEDSVENSGWSHALSFFQHVKVGEMPDLSQFSADAYKEWARRGSTTNQCRRPGGQHGLEPASATACRTAEREPAIPPWQRYSPK